MSDIQLGIYEKALIGIEDWTRFFAQVPEAGFSFVDLSIDESPERAARLDWDRDIRRRVRRAAEDTGTRIGGLCLSLHRRVMPGSRDPEIRRQAAEVYRKGIRLAADLGVSVLQVAGYYAHYEEPDEGARQRWIDSLMAALPQAAHEGVILAVENVDGTDITSVPDVMDIVDLARSPWLQCYPDVGNIAGHGGSSGPELAACEGHLVALHVKDVLPGQPRRVPFGTGIADFDQAFAELHRQEWSGRVMLEMWHDDAPDSLDRCREARRFIEEKASNAGLRIIKEEP
ncbi:L-ribulose-5-phosphate 3-epimerase [Arachnia propionica]|uniref:L-ribulose-5-phosphate 3-epimerase n=1 Tax=Arachnia propionica TaxID=1750 RepID=A0A3P1WXW2_9ACTN|nr:L-ribulose-5-phosphate 3-epimerase [Arachnia propionica]RRD51434.1 L-ribulose-5-phosphate 3-epimerase [Arachnia propionica]